MVSLRILGLAAAVLVSLIAAHPASAQTTLLNDTFNSENNGMGKLSYNSFANFNAGNVDLIGNGYFDAVPGSGLYVDLSGNANGSLTTKTIFALTPGTYELQFDLANPSRGGGYNEALNSTTVSLGSIYSQTFQLPVADSFTHFTEDFTVFAPASGALTFAENHNTPTGDYLNNVSLVQTSPAAVPEASTTVSLGLLLMLGLGGLAVAKKRKRSAASA